MVTTTDQVINNNKQRMSAQGIDVREALEILAARSSRTHDHSRASDHHHSAACGCHHGGIPTEDAVHWGQRISLGGEQDAKDEEEAMAVSLSIEEQKERIAKERAERRIDVEQKLASMTVLELLQCVMGAQEERVATYRNYNK